MADTLGFIVTTPPDSTPVGAEIFDLVVAAGVFDQPVAVAFFGAGTRHLLALPEHSHTRNPSKLWPSASLFGVSEVIAPLEQQHELERQQTGPFYAEVDWLDKAAWRRHIRRWSRILVV